MKALTANRNWMFAIIGSACLVGAAVGVAQKDVSSDVPVAASATELSSIFRDVSKRAMPSIVSIETVSKTSQVADQQMLPFGDDSPFKDLFQNDPRFKDMLKQHQNQPRRAPRKMGTGSGFIINKSGLIMTNSHVVNGADVVKVTLNDGREFTASDIKTDPRSDVAVIKIDAPDLVAIPLGDSSKMEIGDWVLAIGNPFGIGMSVTNGIISAKSRGPGINDREDYLQTDAAINPGNSGGPLLNLRGEVIGINTAISSRSGGYDGVGFAIPVNMARWVSGQLIDHGMVKRSFLGVGIQPISNDLSKSFDIKVGQGAIITQVMEDSPADKAELKTGDIILNFAGKDVSGPRNLQGIVEQLSVGKSYTMELLRDGKRVHKQVTMQEMPKSFSVAKNESPLEDSSKGKQKTSVNDLKIEVQPLTKELANQLGYSDDVNGVVITSVEPGSAAEEAGLMKGMIIEKIGTTEVTTMDQFNLGLKEAKEKDRVLLLVRNHSGARFVVVQK
ncbi:Do family serine endopeptidase [Gimesia chilikensis]|uniref:Putative periplasmic serine endoprotease DegP-like n=1 Tax=Gimesia chilikensis TaxID=2605989 RepID=A0A517PXK1_9PLAN|nr:Do family serine endopeptidase [Gimesia chilikensis]QDT24064.1 putative periplasmic serine endoprotease DegP-like precursor [Gimesia chilikensis]